MHFLCQCCSRHLLGFNVRNTISRTAFSKRTIFLSYNNLQLAKNAARTTAKLKKPGLPKLSDIKKLMLLARPEKYRLIGGITLLAISSGVMMSVPFFMGRIIDLVFKDTGDSVPKSTDSSAISAADSIENDEKSRREQRFHLVTSNMKKYMLGLVVFFSCGAVATFGRVYLMNFAGERVVNRLRTKAFSSIIKQEIAFFDKSKTGELINRLSNDVWTVGYATTMNISDGLRGLVGAIGGTSMMFYVSPTLAVVGLSIVPPVAAIAIVYGRYIRSITKQMNDALAESTDIAEERISNIRTVRAFGAEMSEERRYNRKIDSVLDIAQRESVAKGLFFGFNMLSGNLIMLALLYSGGSLIATGTITVGDLSSFLLYALYVGVSMSGISSFYSELMHGIGASARLFELMDRKPSIPLFGGQQLTQLTGLIEFKNLHFHYPTRKEVQVLKGVNLVVPARSSLAVVGSSGSGKSTLASLLLRFYDASKGSVCIDGIDIRQIDPHCLRSHIGVVTQEPVLFSCSIKENIAYSAERLESVSMFDIEEAARQANAYDFIRQFPQGFDTIMGERGHTLSGGQRQRIAIARALLKNPKILLMDEATSALDSESEHAVRQTFDSLMFGGDRTIIIIAHRLSTILNADQIAVLHDGKIAEIGTYWKLMSMEDGHFRKLVQRQMISLTTDEAEQPPEKELEVDGGGGEGEDGSEGAAEISGKNGATAHGRTPPDEQTKSSKF